MNQGGCAAGEKGGEHGFNDTKDFAPFASSSFAPFA
jgi:hypothetical protein